VDLVIIDGPNLHNTLGTSLAEQTDPDTVRKYLVEWFDIDRLVRATLHIDEPPSLGIVVFHSLKPLGRVKWRLDQSETMSFWGRQATNPDTSAVVVEIPGEQQEKQPYRCEGCGREGFATTTSEKGIDTAITAYLFESVDHWEAACLFSRPKFLAGPSRK